MNIASGKQLDAMGFRPPPLDQLPDDVAKLCAEHAEHRQAVSDARHTKNEAKSREAVGAARRADAELRAEATRAGKPDPGTPNNDDRAQTIADAEHAEASHLAAVEAIYHDLAIRLVEIADEQTEAAQQRLTQQAETVRKLVEKLQAARTDAINDAAFLGWWVSIRDDGRVSRRLGALDRNGGPVGVGQRTVEFNQWTSVANPLERDLAGLSRLANQATPR